MPKSLLSDYSCRDKRQVLWAETRAGAHFVGLV